MRGRFANRQRARRSHQRLECGSLLVEVRMIRRAKHGYIGNKVGEQTLRPDRWLRPQRAKQPGVSQFLLIGTGLRGRERRQTVRGGDDDAISMRVALDDKAPASADLQDGSR